MEARRNKFSPGPRNNSEEPNLKYNISFNAIIYGISNDIFWLRTYNWISHYTLHLWN